MKAKYAVSGFISYSCIDRAEFSFECMMNIKMDNGTSQVYLLHTWDGKVLLHSICMYATDDTDLLIDFAEPHPMVLTRESVRLYSVSDDPL